MLQMKKCSASLDLMFQLDVDALLHLQLPAAWTVDVPNRTLTFHGSVKTNLTFPQRNADESTVVELYTEGGSFEDIKAASFAFCDVIR